MQLLAIKIPYTDLSVRATCSHAAVSHTEGNRVYCFRVCADQRTSVEVLNPAGFSGRKGRTGQLSGVFGAVCKMPSDGGSFIPRLFCAGQLHWRSPQITTGFGVLRHVLYASFRRLAIARCQAERTPKASASGIYRSAEHKHAEYNAGAPALQPPNTSCIHCQFHQPTYLF